MSNLLDVIRKNIEFVGISLLLMIIVFVIARASEVLIEKRNGVKFASKNTRSPSDSIRGACHVRSAAHAGSWSSPCRHSGPAG